MNEFIKVRDSETGEKMWINISTIDRVRKPETTGNYIAYVFNKYSKRYRGYVILSDNDALKLVGEYSIC